MEIGIVEKEIIHKLPSMSSSYLTACVPISTTFHYFLKSLINTIFISRTRTSVIIGGIRFCRHAPNRAVAAEIEPAIFCLLDRRFTTTPQQSPIRKKDF